MGILVGRSRVAAVAVVVAMMVVGVLGQTPTQSCASNLVPCQPYLASEKPPESCCGPLKDAVENQLQCLCALFNSKDILAAFKINVTQALELPVHCGLSNNLAACNAVAPGASTTPPATPGGHNAAFKAAWMGWSGLMSLFLFVWSIMA